MHATKNGLKSVSFPCYLGSRSDSEAELEEEDDRRWRPNFRVDVVGYDDAEEEEEEEEEAEEEEDPEDEEEEEEEVELEWRLFWRPPSSPEETLKDTKMENIHEKIYIVMP